MRRRWAIDGAFAAGLASLVAAAYAPSLRHGPRADQWCYLIDTMEVHTVRDAVAATYSYNRTRVHSPGDTDLFRPVLFALLAAEKVLFEGDQPRIQVVGIVLHWVVCLLLLTVLRQVAGLAPAPPGDPPRTWPDPLPCALVAFFALNPATMELVIFAHLHGYLLFLVLLLGAVALVLRHLTGPRAGCLASPALWGAWGLTLVSAFTYELGQVFAVLAGLLVAAAGCPRTGWLKAARPVVLFALVPLTYQAVNAHDLEVHRGSYSPEGAPAAVRDRMFTTATLTHSVRFALFTAVHPVCPSALRLSYVEGRIHQPEVFWDGRVRWHGWPAVAASAAVLALAAGSGLVGLRNLLRRGDRPLLLVVGLFAGLYAVYAGVTVLGRMNLRPDPHPTLVRNTYYSYTAFLFLGIGLYAAWQGLGRGGPGGRVRAWLFAGLLVLTAVGGKRVREVNLDIAVRMTPETRPLRAVQQFLAAHRDEPDLSLAIDYANSDPVPRVCGRPITWIVFRRVLSDAPKYGVVIRGSKAVVVHGPAGEATRGN